MLEPSIPSLPTSTPLAAGNPGPEAKGLTHNLDRESGLSLNTGDIRTVSSSQGTIYHSFASDVRRGTVTSELERTDHSVTYLAPAIVRHRSHRPHKEVSNLRATVGREQYDVRSPFIGRVQRAPSAGLSPLIFSAPDASGTLVLWNPTSGSVAEQFLQQEYLHQEERNRILALMLAEQESCKGSFRGLESLSTENERLRSELSRTSTRADELQRRHDAQSKVLDSAHSQLKFKTEQITNASRDYEKHQGDLSAHSAQITDLQKRCDAQSQDILSTRHDLQAKVSLLEEKENDIISLSDKVAQAEHKNRTMADQVATAQGAVDQLRVELSSSSSRTTEVQKRYEAQSQELDAARDELRQLKGLYRNDSPDQNVADHIRSALEEKNQQIGVLREDLAVSTSRNNELQKSYETLSRDVSDLRDELKVKTSHCESTITSLNSQVERWKSLDGANKEQIATSLKQVKELQDCLSSSTSQLAQLQSRYDVQSRELTTVRDELHSSILSCDSKERTIVSLNTKVEHWEGASAKQVEQLATALKQVKELQRDPTSVPRYIELQTLYKEQTDKLEAAQQHLSTSASDIEKLRNLYEERSNELTTVRKELDVSISHRESKDLTIAALDTEVQKWKDAGANESKQVATILERAKKLEGDLSTSTSKLDELQRLYEEQSREFVRVRNELNTSVASGKDKDLTISTLTTEIGQWKGAGVDEPKKVTVILELVEKLRGDLSTSTSKLDELQNIHGKQSDELASVRDDLRASVSSGKDMNFTIAGLTDEVQQWKDAGADESKQVATLVKQVKRLQDDLATSTSKLDELQILYQNQSDALTVVHEELQISISSAKEKDVIISTLTAEVGEWKSAGVDEPKKVAVILEQVEKLRQEHSTSASQLVQLRTVYEEQSSTLTVVQKELQASISSGKHKDVTIIAPTDEVQQWKDASASESREVATILKQVAKLQQNLSTSVSELEELHNLYEEQSSKLTAVQNELKASISTGEKQGLTIAALTEEVRRWKDAGSNESKQVATILEQVDRLQSDLSASASKLAQFKDLYEQQLHDLAIVRKELQARILSEEGKDRELAVTREDLEQLRDDLTTATSQIERLKESEAAAADELTAADKDLEQLRRDLSASSSQIIEIWQRYEAQFSQLEQWKNSDATKALQLTAADEKLELLRQELSTMSSQLDKVHRFLAIVDTHADTAIIQMVQKLNGEVQQNTSFIAECILDEFRPQTKKSSKEQDPAIQRVSVYIGQAFAGSLRRRKRDDLALYLQIAFQAFLTHYLSGVISAWTVEKGHNDAIDKIYQRLQKQEAQTISGHWRSLTRTYIWPTCMSNPDTIISSTVAGLSDIIVAAGCATSASTAKWTVTSKFLDKVSSIISIAGQLSKMIGEVVSSDFEVLAVQPDVVFEGSTMEEDVEDYDEIRDTAGGTATGEKVLCSTRLGLTKRMPLESGKVTLTAMKAKVLLASFLNA